MGIKELFVSHKIAFALKELGFDEPCFGIYDDKGNWSVVRFDGKTHTVNNSYYFHLKRQSPDHLELDKICSAPLYQQVVDWFREEHNIEITANKFTYKNGRRIYDYDVSINELEDDREDDLDGYESYYDALNVAIKRTIELIKVKTL